MQSKNLGQIVKLALIVAIGNWWFWRMVKIDLLLASLCLVLSVLFSLKLLKKDPLVFTRLLIGAFILVAALSLYHGSDRGLFITQPLENDQLQKRHEYYAKDLKKVYRNRFGLYYHQRLIPLAHRFQKNLFANLDIGLYFFASHPRERLGASEFNKYPFVLLPLLILGLIRVIAKPIKIVVAYFLGALIMSAFLHPGYNLGPVLFYPLINGLLILGLVKLMPL